VKAWQIFIVGCIALAAIWFFAAWEFIVAGAISVLIIVVVALGFILRPRNEVFYFRTTLYKTNADGDFFVEHDRIAVRLEVARLWLLFLPTIFGIAFLLITSAAGTTWHFSILEHLEEISPIYFYLLRFPLGAVFAIVWVWISERWVLRNAGETCSATSLSSMAGKVSYSFIDRHGEYYGGEAFPFDLTRSTVLATMVLYNTNKPDSNKIGMGLLFHRLVIIGRGVTDVDEATVNGHTAPAPTTA
jgi:hypothetical protein